MGTPRQSTGGQKLKLEEEKLLELNVPKVEDLHDCLGAAAEKGIYH